MSRPRPWLRRSPEPPATSPATGSTTPPAAGTAPAPAAPVVPQFLAVVLGLAGFVIGIAGIRAVADLIAPIFLGINLVIAAAPMDTWLVRHRVPRLVSAIVTGLLIVVGLVGFFALLGWAIASLVGLMPAYSTQFDHLYDDALALLQQWGVSQDQILGALQGVNPQDIIGVAQSVLANAQSLLSLLTVLVTVLVFLMMDLVGFRDRLTLAATDHPQVVRSLLHFGQGVRRYWIVSTLFGLIVAVLDVWALMWLGVPLALVWGIVSFLTNYIPNIGFVLGLIPPTLLGLLDQGPGTALAVVTAYCLLNFVIQTLIQPKFAGDAVGVTPTVSFVSLLFWTWVLGPLGALLALPATLLVKAVLIDSDPRARWVNFLIASSPARAERDSL